MTRSRLQEPFVKELAETFHATRKRLLRRLAGGEAPAEVVDDELRGLYHGLFVIFDGGTSLAEQGLIEIIDEDGQVFDQNLHETCFRSWDAAAKS
jgi:hypothetical protein